MKRYGPDSLNSWLVAAGLTFLCMVIYAVVRLSGVLFVASMDRFGVDRKSASLPYILTDFIQAISSPLTGFLASKFEARLVMVLGCFVSGVGIASCFFAESIETVTICWGVILGVGFGLSVPLLALVITQHFVEKRAIAMGIVFVGGYFGYSALPTFAELFIEYYGLSGTFLLLAGIVFNCIPVALLLRKPKFSTVEDEAIPSRDEFAIAQSIEDVDMSRKGCNNGANSKELVNCCLEPESNTENLNVTKESRGGDNVKSITDCKGVVNYHSELKDKIRNITKRSEGGVIVRNEDDCKGVENFGLELESSTKIDSPNVTKRSGGAGNTKNVKDCRGTTEHSDVILFKSPKLNKEGKYRKVLETSRTNSSIKECSQNNKKKDQPLSAFRVFLEPVYIVILIAEAVFEGSMIAFVTILVDFSLDVGLALSDTKFVLISFSVFSTVGLVSFGWVTDDGHLSLTTFSGVLLVLRCTTCSFIAFSKSMPVLLTAVALHGLCESGLSNLFPLIIAEYYAPEVHGVAISCRLFLCAPVYLVMPTLIGYFRDGLGSYFYLFLLISVGSFICGVLCYFIPQLSKCRCGREDDSLLRHKSSDI